MKKIIVILLVLSPNIFAFDLKPVIDRNFYENSAGIFKEDNYLYKNELAVSKDGSVFILPQNGFKIYKLDRSGSIILSFGREGGNPGEFLYSPKIHGIWENEIYTSDNQGRINIFSLDGELQRLVKVDYNVQSIFPMEENYVILGFVVTSYGWKDIVVLKNRESGKENIILEKRFNEDDEKEVVIEVPRDNIPNSTFQEKIYNRLKGSDKKKIKDYYSYNKEEDQWNLKSNMDMNKVYTLLSKVNYYPGVYTIPNPFSDNRSFITPLDSKYFIFGNNMDKNLTKISDRGVVIEEVNTNITPLEITQEDRNEFYRNSVDMIKKAGYSTEPADVILEDGFFNKYLPYYYKMISDSGQNTRLFLYTNEGAENRFKFFNLKDEKVKEYTLIMDEKLNISPIVNNIVFIDDWVYAVTIIEENGVTTNRLVKGKLSY